MNLPLDISGPVVIGMGMGMLLLMLETAKRWSRPSRYRRPRARAYAWGPHRRNDLNVSVPPTSQIPDAADQLRAVENATYSAKPLLRYQERKVFSAAEVAVAEAGVPWRVFAQVSLGEVLDCPDREGFNAINAKRVDLLLTDEQFRPVAAIEYQGSGHHIGKAAARDAVKKEALRKAGIAFIEITADHGPADVRREIGRLAFARTRDPRETMRKVTGA